MIRITKKPEQHPPVEYAKGPKAGSCKLTEATNDLNDLFQTNPELFDGSQKSPTFSVDNGLYGHPDLKKALKDSQDAKCCFCEAKVVHICPGDVEHFRPKRGYDQGDGNGLQKHGYYWLSYDWDNLLFCCNQCNRRDKANLFPLLDDANRARSPADDLDAEIPLFIHPIKEDPTDYITFHEEVAAPVTAGEPRAIATIETLQLNENIPDGKRERRKKAFDTVATLMRFAPLPIPNPYLPDEDILDARHKVELALKPESQYAGMLQANFAHRITWPTPTLAPQIL